MVGRLLLRRCDLAVASVGFRAACLVLVWLTLRPVLLISSVVASSALLMILRILLPWLGVIGARLLAALLRLAMRGLLGLHAPVPAAASPSLLPSKLPFSRHASQSRLCLHWKGGAVGKLARSLMSFHHHIEVSCRRLGLDLAG